MRYRYLDNHRLHRMLVRYAKVLAVVVFVLIIIAIYITVDTYIQQSDKSEVTSRESHSVQTSKANVITTEYFQFQAPPGWVEVSNETKPPLFVYREINNTLIKRELRIYVDTPAEELRSSYVLPVSVSDDRLVPGAVSEHCKNDSAFSATQRSPANIIWDGVAIMCEPDSIEYNVVIGAKGNRQGISMKRPSGDSISYAIIYKDLTASPSSVDLYIILRSFQAR